MALSSILGWILGLGGLFGVTFTGSVVYFEQTTYDQEQEAFKTTLQQFVDGNPSKINIGDMETTDEKIDVEALEEQGKVVIRYQGRIKGYDRKGEPIYTLDKPHYLIFDKHDLTGEKFTGDPVWGNLQPPIPYQSEE